MSLISAIAGWMNPPAPDTTQRRAIDRAADTIEPLMKTVSGYERRLAPAIEAAMSYCGTLVDGIPGPVDINAKAFAADPLIHAIFGSVEDISSMIGTSESVRGFMGIGHHALDKEFFALLGMRRYEKKVTGTTFQDGFVRNEVPQTLLYFGDHTLSCVSPDFQAARNALCDAAFDSLVASFAAQVKALRDERQNLRTSIDVARARKQDRSELEERLRQASEALSPQRLIATMTEWLGNPAAHLYLMPTTLCVDSMGVIVETESRPRDAATLSFPELVGRDRRHWLVLLARLAREDALDAIAQREKAHRYIII
jgi:hypothetical protein